MVSRGYTGIINVSQNHGPLVVVDYITSPNTWILKSDLNFGNYPYIYIQTHYAGILFSYSLLTWVCRSRVVAVKSPTTRMEPPLKRMVVASI